MKDDASLEEVEVRLTFRADAVVESKSCRKKLCTESDMLGKFTHNTMSSLMLLLVNCENVVLLPQHMFQAIEDESLQQMQIGTHIDRNVRRQLF